MRSKYDVEVTEDDLDDALDSAITTVRARLRDLRAGSLVLADTSVSFAVTLWSGHDLALAHLGDAAAFMQEGSETTGENGWTWRRE
jgi:hypothetical protein